MTGYASAKSASCPVNNPIFDTANTLDSFFIDHSTSSRQGIQGKMEDSRLPDLKRYTKQIVREAHQPGGLIDQGEFTIAVARRQITKSLGLEEGSLDGKPWKQVVKEEVTRVMVCSSSYDMVVKQCGVCGTLTTGLMI
jgi:hypothetical protein